LFDSNDPVLKYAEIQKSFLKDLDPSFITDLFRAEFDSEKIPLY